MHYPHKQFVPKIKYAIILPETMLITNAKSQNY